MLFRSFFQESKQMDLTYIIVLAAMVFVLSGMVGYLYWQQTSLVQRVNALSYALSSHLTAVARPEPEDVQEAEVPESSQVIEEVDETEEAEEVEDDRASVENVSAPPAELKSEPEADIDDIQSKTTKQLQELLTKKGIPFGKRESKTTLMELLKATA